ncbi:MAG: hypothetical protein DWQ29_14285 [Planctomycetota bacterium]|nr:MAG: hypothetical protein DWQ29_14285 [Planctomycetota bacterium]
MNEASHAFFAFSLRLRVFALKYVNPMHAAYGDCRAHPLTLRGAGTKMPGRVFTADAHCIP